MELNEERIRELVSEEAKRIMMKWTSVEPIVACITMQYYMHGHFNYFYVNARRLRLLDDKPMPLTTKCLFECLEIIKKNPKRFIKQTVDLKETSNEHSRGSTDSPQQISAEIVPATDPGCDREQEV